MTSKFYVNVYRTNVAGSIGTAYPSLEMANQMAGRGRTCVIECDPALQQARVINLSLEAVKGPEDAA